ncbi:hypothetical protein [Pseudaminobacter sp. NGMCC 1.201702]|uniref:hypothetical protein n=1 Tax=Pseudaminobacter sp. NGMCC 1.201702 TaxID=3391825 RepID=UPI0039EEBC49
MSTIVAARSTRHRSQHSRANIRFLELRRRALVKELAAVNAELRRARPVVRAEDDEWDFDPRVVECGL